jgi:predicted transposase YdaD
MHQPHDKLFKAGFSDPETTARFLRSQLPPALTAAIDWSSLRLEPGSFIDSHFIRCGMNLCSISCRV